MIVGCSVLQFPSLKCDVKVFAELFLMIFFCVCFSLRDCLRTQMLVVCGRLWTNIMWPSSTRLRPPSGCWWNTAASRCRSESCLNITKWLPVIWFILRHNPVFSSKAVFIATGRWCSPSYRLCRYKRESLKVLGTVGEPINPEAWQWYYTVVGEKKCPIVDTFWQTETVS